MGLILGKFPSIEKIVSDGFLISHGERNAKVDKLRNTPNTNDIVSIIQRNLIGKNSLFFPPKNLLQLNQALRNSSPPSIRTNSALSCRAVKIFPCSSA